MFKVYVMLFFFSYTDLLLFLYSMLTPSVPDVLYTFSSISEISLLYRISWTNVTYVCAIRLRGLRQTADDQRYILFYLYLFIFFKERSLSKSLQRGEDSTFDQLLLAFGCVAEHCLPSLLRTLFAWYDRQGVEWGSTDAKYKDPSKSKG